MALLRVALITAAALAAAVFLGAGDFALAGGSVACGKGTSPTRQLGFGSENWRTYCRPCVLALRTYGRTEAFFPPIN